jgi:hypothetical protein
MLIIPPIIHYHNITNDDEQEEEDEFEITRNKVTDITRSMQKYHIIELDQQSPIILDNSDRPLSPLSILCPTTNSLIQTRVLEETTFYSCDNDNQVEDEEIEEEEENVLIWRNKFLDLMSNVITYSENLESISTELLRTEGQVRELILLQKAMLEQLDEKEKIYMKKLDEYNHVSKQQITLIDNLIELDQDLDITTIEKKKKDNRRSVMTMATTATGTTLSTIYHWQSSERSQHHQNHQLERRSISTSNTSIDSRYYRNHDNNEERNNDITSMEDIVNTLRWEIGLWIGGGIGTGHVIHSFESPLHGVELIIAGSGTVATTSIEESLIQSSSIQHINFHKHHYMLHINQHDRDTKFQLLPKYLWTPDSQANQCQFKTCSNLFSLFQRRHHCRR